MSKELNMKTERLVILLSPEEKQAITGKAKALKLSAGEMVRRAVENYRPDDDEESILGALADELINAAAESRALLEEALKELGETREYFAARRGRDRRAA
jgi:hypothetical protein